MGATYDPQPRVQSKTQLHVDDQIEMHKSMGQRSDGAIVPLLGYKSLSRTKLFLFIKSGKSVGL